MENENREAKFFFFWHPLKRLSQHPPQVSVFPLISEGPGMRVFGTFFFFGFFWGDFYNVYFFILGWTRWRVLNLLTSLLLWLLRAKMNSKKSQNSVKIPLHPRNTELIWTRIYNWTWRRQHIERLKPHFLVRTSFQTPPSAGENFSRFFLDKMNFFQIFTSGVRCIVYWRKNSVVHNHKVRGSKFIQKINFEVATNSLRDGEFFWNAKKLENFGVIGRQIFSEIVASFQKGSNGKGAKRQYFFHRKNFFFWKFFGTKMFFLKNWSTILVHMYSPSFGGWIIFQEKKDGPTQDKANFAEKWKTIKVKVKEWEIEVSKKPTNALRENEEERKTLEWSHSFVKKPGWFCQ